MDAHVGKNLFENCIKGLLKSKTRILVTHQLQFLPSVDRIVVLKDGRIIEDGTFQQLMSAKSELYNLYTTHIEKEKEGTAKEKDKTTDQTSSKLKKSSQSSLRNSGQKHSDFKEEDESEEDESKLILEEDRVVGQVSWKVWKTYLTAMGGILLAIAIFFIYSFRSAATLSIGNHTNNANSHFAYFQLNSIYFFQTGFWLSYWSSSPDDNPLSFYLIGYISLNAISTLFIIL